MLLGRKSLDMGKSLLNFYVSVQFFLQLFLLFSMIIITFVCEISLPLHISHFYHTTAKPLLFRQMKHFSSYLKQTRFLFLMLCLCIWHRNTLLTTAGSNIFLAFLPAQLHINSATALGVKNCPKAFKCLYPACLAYIFSCSISSSFTKISFHLTINLILCFYLILTISI